MATKSKQAVLALTEPEPETWGEQFSRQVARHGGMKQIVSWIHDRLGDASLGQYTAFNELTKRKTAPVDPKNRHRAVLVLVVIGIRPESFGLSFDDLPRFYDVNTVVDLLFRRSGWTTSDDSDLSRYRPTESSIRTSRSSAA